MEEEQDFESPGQMPQNLTRLPCSYCGQIQFSCYIKYHEDTYHSQVSNGIHECDKCPKRFHYDSALIKHKQIHKRKQMEKERKWSEKLLNGVERKHFCIDCNRPLAGDISLHLSTYHIKKPVVKCSECNHGCFWHKHNMLKHIGIMHGGNGKVIDNRSSIKEEIEELRDRLIRLTADGRKVEKQQKAVKIPQALWICDCCKSEFKSRDSLVDHVRRRHLLISPPKFDCDTCGKVFSEKNRSLVIHLQTHEDRQRSLECEICGAKFKFGQYLRAHRAKVHSEEDVQCDECGRVFSGYFKANLARHFTVEHNKENYKQLHCDQCPFKTGDKSHLVRHFETTHRLIRATFECELCDSCFSHPAYLRCHMKKHQQRQTLLVCDACDAQFHIQTGLLAHIQRIHVRLGQFQCDKCEAAFPHKANLWAHHRVVHREKVITCDLCLRKCATKSDMIRHYQQVHLGDRPFRCIQCDGAFWSADQLKIHQVMRHELSGTRFACDHCDASFMQRGVLLVHIRRVHLKLDRLECEQCGQIFCDKSTLLRHKQTLHKRKRFIICDLCLKTFGSRGELTTHCLNTHMQLRPFECSDCGKMFRSNGHFERHKMGKWHKKFE